LELPEIPGRSRSPPGPETGWPFARQLTLAVFGGALLAIGAGEKVET
jgi:hypothetical protein